MGNLIGGGSQKKALALQQQQAQAQQRRQLADLARQQAETDQAASAKTGRRNVGGQMLTFLSGDGIDTLGGA
ncbi:hypothetical protein FNA46_07830 [Rhizobium straminoryzae]|uniref:Uncharacterized protein n=1 Tax=Rhizobium straminoryzae TaxID=1387186 RepID=A0A549TCY1_9HYPH|nr:hypothetical protein FNA46_07830 [Rhizobium straminoryzae]